MKCFDIIEFDCGHGCSSEGIVIAIDEEKDIIKVKDLMDGSVWRGSVEQARVLEPEEISEALMHAGSQIRSLLPPYGPRSKKA